MPTYFLLNRQIWIKSIVSRQVCGEDLRDATHDRAIQVLRQTPATVSMLVFRDESQVKDDEMYDVFTVDLMKKHGKGLGLSIVGRRNDVGVYISDVVSVASKMIQNFENFSLGLQIF